MTSTACTWLTNTGQRLAETLALVWSCLRPEAPDGAVSLTPSLQTCGLRAPFMLFNIIENLKELCFCSLYSKSSINGNNTCL